jgi:hypothetical protein
MRTRIAEPAHVYKNNKCKLEFKGKNSKSKCRQEFKDSSDINKIVARFHRTGVLSTGELTHTRQPMYGDYEGIDYTETCRKIAKVEQDFMQEEPEVRAIYGNDPNRWLAGLQENEQKAAQEAINKEKASEEAKPPEEEPKATETTTETQTETLKETPS